MFTDNRISTAMVKTVFAEEITARDGIVSDTFDDGQRLFVRSILPAVEEVRQGSRPGWRGAENERLRGVGASLRLSPGLQQRSHHGPGDRNVASCRDRRPRSRRSRARAPPSDPSLCIARGVHGHGATDEIGARCPGRFSAVAHAVSQPVTRDHHDRRPSAILRGRRSICVRAGERDYGNGSRNVGPRHAVAPRRVGRRCARRSRAAAAARSCTSDWPS